MVEIDDVRVLCMRTMINIHDYDNEYEDNNDNVMML